MLDEFLEYPEVGDDLLSINETKHIKDHFIAIMEIIHGKRPLPEIHKHLEEIAAVLDLENELNEIEGEE